MIKSIRLQNFFSFKDTTIDLTDQNVLIGINGSGKTNLLRALELLKAAAKGGLRELILREWGGFDEILFAGDDGGVVTLNYTFNIKGFLPSNKERRDVHYSLHLRKGNQLYNYFISEVLITDTNEVIFSNLDEELHLNERFIKYSFGQKEFGQIASNESVLFKLRNASLNVEISEVWDVVYNIEVYPLFVSNKIRKAVIATSEKRLLTDGSNLAQILNTFNIINRDLQKLIEEKLREVNSRFESIAFHHIGAGSIELMLAEVGLRRSIHTSKISDGTLKFLCLLCIFYNLDRGSVICIDEPETGLHPDMIAAVAEGIKYAAETSQIIITTHSSFLLDLFNLSNIIVLEKDESNATIAKRYTEENFKGWYDDFVVGKMWRQGDIGGNRW